MKKSVGVPIIHKNLCRNMPTRKKPMIGAQPKCRPTQKFVTSAKKMFFIKERKFDFSTKHG